MAEPYQNHADEGKEILENDTVYEGLCVVFADDKAHYEDDIVNPSPAVIASGDALIFFVVGKNFVTVLFPFLFKFFVGHLLDVECWTLNVDDY